MLGETAFLFLCSQTLLYYFTGLKMFAAKNKKKFGLPYVIDTYENNKAGTTSDYLIKFKTPNIIAPKEAIPDVSPTISAAESGFLSACFGTKISAPGFTMG